MTIDITTLAQAFAKHITAALTPEQLAQVNERNADPTDCYCCASHDFIDANECMLAAYKDLGITFDCESDEQAYATDEAWMKARLAGFDAEKVAS